jgi:hypothetical protein
MLFWVGSTWEKIMRRVFLTLLLTILSIHSHASEKAVAKMHGYLVKVQFSYRDGNKDFNTHHEIIVNEDNQDWIPLTTGKEGVALIGKLHKVEKGIFTTECMVVDTASMPVSIQRMGIVSELGKTAEIKSEYLQQKVKISLLATPTEYTQGPAIAE